MTASKKSGACNKSNVPRCEVVEKPEASTHVRNFVYHVVEEGKPNKYLLKLSPNDFFLVCEDGLKACFIPALRAYQSQVSGYKGKSDDGAFKVKKILSCCIAPNGKPLFNVQWAKPFDHPVWNSELVEEAMVNSEADNEVFQQWKKENGFE